MFTGIVSTKGSLRQIAEIGGDCRLTIETDSIDLEHCAAGDSIAVSGVCLTMLEPGKGRFHADVSRETLDVTTLGNLTEGSEINLELALSLQDRLGGHMVSGHVDGKGCLVSRHPDARAERFEFELPLNLARYVAKKGSVCIDGVSLTINDTVRNRFSVCLIPHTLEITTLGKLEPGNEVNIEVDLVARYLERLVSPELSADSTTA